MTQSDQVDQKRALVFPGQGSQSVGMGQELYDSSGAARAVFQEADETLGIKLSKLIFQGPGWKLQSTINSQPAIMTVSIAALKAWEEFTGSKLEPPAALAGHSLGEYTSMVAAGVVSFADGVSLVRKRGQLMEWASKDRPGGMAVILGLDEVATLQVCSETGVELANINADDQIVISGDKIAVAQAMDLATARGATKTIPLRVSGAFHSSLMEKAREGLSEAIGAMEFKDPVSPIIANSDCAELRSGEQICEELIRGLCQCVRWRDTVRHMVDSGISQFVELGPASILSSLIRRIDRSVEAMTLSSPASIQKMSEVGA